MKAIILARVSNKEQDSNEAQLIRINEYVARKGLEPWKTFELEESSTKGDRTQFQEILHIVKKSRKSLAIVVDTVDRLQRSFRESVIFDDLRKKGKVELHFYREGLVINKDSNSADLLRWDMAVMFARSYVLQLSDNVKRKFEQMRRNGEIPSAVRIGYMRVTLEDGKKDIVPDPERAHLIQKLFELYATGNYSIPSLREKITRLGLRSVNGNKLSQSNIATILNDTVYHGMAYSPKHNLRYPHKYKKIITQMLFDECQGVIRKRGKKRTKELSKMYIFKGILACKKCGCAMTPETKTKKSGRTFIYYSCTNAKGICKRIYIPEKELLKPIYKIFDAFTRIPAVVQEKLVEELRSILDGESKFHKLEIARIRAEYDKVEKRLSRLTDMYLDERISLGRYENKLQELKDRQQILNIELEEYTNADHQYHIHVATVLDLSRNMGAIFESSELDEKRAIFNFILQNPVVNGKKLEFSLIKPLETVLELARFPDVCRCKEKFRTPYWEKFAQGAHFLQSDFTHAKS